LIASAASQRATVAGLIMSTMPWPTASLASSVTDHRDNGTPACSGGVQASALT